MYQVIHQADTMLDNIPDGYLLAQCPSVARSVFSGSQSECETFALDLVTRLGGFTIEEIEETDSELNPTGNTAIGFAKETESGFEYVYVQAQ